MTTSYMFDDQLWKLNSVIHVNWHVPDSYYVVKLNVMLFVQVYSFMWTTEQNENLFCEKSPN